MTKCCYMIFKPPSKTIKDGDKELELVLNGQKLKHVTHTKFLGVTIDENLNWEQRIKDLIFIEPYEKICAPRDSQRSLLYIG